MAGLVEFLAARLDEDEAAAKAATEGPWAWEATGDKDSSWAVGLVQDEGGNSLTGELEHGQGVVIDGVCESINGDLADAAHIGRHHPARVLREVEAKRAILAAWPDPFGHWTAEQAEAARAMKAEILRKLAAVYSDHPDYRQEWKP